MALTKIDDRGLKTPIDLIDNEKLRFGTGNDLEVFHDGSNSYIKDVGTGNLLIDQSTANVLYIRSDDLRLSTWTGTETYIDCNVNGSVELYYDDVKKFETTSAGATIHRDLTLNHASGDTALRWAVGGTNKFSVYESSGTLRFYDNTNSAERFRIDSSGRLLLGAGAVSLPKGSAAGSFDLDNGNITMCIGGNSNSTGRTDSTDKVNRITSPPYTNTEEPVALLSSFNQSGNSSIAYGGGSSQTNTVTYHSFYTAANTTTTTGTEVFRIQSDGAKALGDFVFDNQSNAGKDVWWDESADALKFSDNTYAYFGTGNDLQIYFDGTHSIIDHTSTSGSMSLRADGIKLQTTHSTPEDYLICNEGGGVEIYHHNVKKCQTTDYGLDAYTIKPYDDNAHDLGASDQRWDDVYATNGTIQTSDRNAKKDIVKSDLGLTFINAVEPVSYKFKTGSRTHYGVIAQDLETVLDGKDFAGLTKDTETGNYGVRYTELISPLIKAVQELSAEVNTLKTEIAALKAA